MIKQKTNNYKEKTILLFKDLNIIEPIQKALKDEGYFEATPIQEKCIPLLFDGKDLLGCAQTGTGKTAAFAIPILQGISSQPKNTREKTKIKALVLAPTRELAIQIGESFKTYGKHLNLKTLVIFGGVSQNPQTMALRSGIDILVATPGRLLDLINQKFVALKHVKYFVLDEADYMLDMGMIHDVRRIIKHIPQLRQTMFFSATMPTEIAKLANQILKNPAKVKVAPISSAVDIIQQSVYHVNKKNKIHLLIHLLKDASITSVLVFSRTKHGANKIVKLLGRSGIEAQPIHGDKSQTARQKALKSFKNGETRVLVATDIAARGIDVNELYYVINFDLPHVPETYVHRIGRTGRAGLGGIAISFCTEEEKQLLNAIQKLISKKIDVVNEHPYPLVQIPVEPKVEHTKEYSSSKNRSNSKSRSNNKNRNNNSNIKGSVKKSS